MLQVEEETESKEHGISNCNRKLHQRDLAVSFPVIITLTQIEHQIMLPRRETR